MWDLGPGVKTGGAGTCCDKDSHTNGGISSLDVVSIRPWKSSSGASPKGFETIPLSIKHWSSVLADSHVVTGHWRAP